MSPHMVEEFCRIDWADRPGTTALRLSFNGNIMDERAQAKVIPWIEKFRST